MPALLAKRLIPASSTGGVDPGFLTFAWVAPLVGQSRKVRISMSLEHLRQLYFRAAPLLNLLNKWRLAIIDKDEKGIRESLDTFTAAARAFEPEIGAVRDLKRLDDEHFIASGLWRHGGKHGPEPPQPPWPNLIPFSQRAKRFIEKLDETLTESNHEYGSSSEVISRIYLTALISELNAIQDALEEPAGDADGQISRTQLAKILGLDPKTLQNRAREMPEPLGTNQDGDPVYLYSAAKESLSKMYPKKAFMLPDYENAINQQH